MHALRKGTRGYRVQCFVFLSLVTSLAMGQQASFRLGSGSASAGGTGTINLTLADLNGAAPASLQFTLAYPTSSIAGLTLSAGSSANSARKVLTCTNETIGQASCLLYGIDATVIPNGILATIGVQLTAKPSSAVVPVTLNSISVSDANGEVIGNTSSNGSVTVTPNDSALSSVSCDPTSVSTAGSVQCTVALLKATGTALTASLASSSRLVTVPASVVVAANASSTQFVASVNKFKHPHSVVLTVTANGIVKTTEVQLQPDVTPAKLTLSGSLGTGTGVATDSVALRSSSGQLLQSIASDTSGSFTFSGVAAGSYTVTPSGSGVVFSPSSRAVIATSTNVTGINFSSQSSSPTTGKITLDMRVSKDQQASSATVTAPALTTHAMNELLLALVSTDAVQSRNTVVNSVSGGGLIWTLVVRSNKQAGTSEIWRAFSKVPLSNVAVTASLSDQVVSSISVVALAGVQATGAGGSGSIGATAQDSGSSGLPTASLTTTKNGSLIVGVGNDYDNAISRTPLSGQQLLHQDLSATGDTYWVQIISNTVPFAGTRIIFGDSAPSSDQFNLAICEVLPAGGN